MGTEERSETRESGRERALKLYVVLSRAANAVHRVTDADITRHGLTTGEFAVLDVLYHKGPQVLGEIQRKVLVSSGGVTYLVDRLEAQGLVERRDSPTDRRARIASLTSKGRALMDRIFPGHAEAIAGAVAGLSAPEQEAAIALLRKLGRSVTE